MDWYLTRGLAAASRSKTGRGQVTAPIFLLLPQVKLPKRLDLGRDAERAHVVVEAGRDFDAALGGRTVRLSFAAGAPAIADAIERIIAFQA